MNKPLLKWSPAVPIRKPDNIISSRAREKNHLGFKPSYENDPVEHMNLLMSNEYMKIWFRERAVYEKDTYTREAIIKEENKIKRRFVQRMMTYRRPTKNQFIDECIEKRKLEKNKDQYSNVNDRQYEKYKYKPQCPAGKKEIQTSQSSSNEQNSTPPKGNKKQITEKKNQTTKVVKQNTERKDQAIKKTKQSTEKKNDISNECDNCECCNCETVDSC